MSITSTTYLNENVHLQFQFRLVFLLNIFYMQHYELYSKYIIQKRMTLDIINWTELSTGNQTWEIQIVTCTVEI